MYDLASRAVGMSVISATRAVGAGWGEAHQQRAPLPRAVGHHHPGHRALIPCVPEEGLPLWRDGDCGQELRWHPRPQVVLQVSRGRQESGAEPSCIGQASLPFLPMATS